MAAVADAACAYPTCGRAVANTENAISRDNSPFEKLSDLIMFSP
jgi:hypothetical protein